MKKYAVLFLSFCCLSVYGQEVDSLKIKTDSINTKINSFEEKIDSLEIKKEKIIQADTVRKWKKGGLIAVDFAQASYTNWAAGGINSLSGVGRFNVFANYKAEKSTWDNSLDIAYGLIKIGDAPLQKSEDKIEFNSKFGEFAFKNWYYSALLNFKSQLDVGYNYPNDTIVVSHFMAPATALGALGLDYKSKDKTFSFFVSPLTGKITFVNDQRLADAGAFGVEAAEYDTAGVKIKDGQTIRYEFGAYMKMTFKKEIFKNVNLETKLELFTNYLDHPENVDVNWETVLTMKVNRFLSCMLNTQLIYDHDIPVPYERMEGGQLVTGTGPRLQFKEVLSVGLAVKF